KKAYDRYVWYHAYLCKKFGFQPKKHIVSHKQLDPQRRSDPQSWLEPNGVTWKQFINDVQKYFDNWNGKTSATPPTSKPGGSTGSSTAPRSEEHTSELQSRFDLVC